MQVAEQMINPYGDDDEDFELNYLLDRHSEVKHIFAQIHALSFVTSNKISGYSFGNGSPF